MKKKQECPSHFDEFEQEIWNAPPEQLKVMDFDRYKWTCAVLGCCNKTTSLKDFGLFPYMKTNLRRDWFDINNQILYCAKHWKQYRAGINLPQKVINSGTELIEKIGVGLGFSEKDSLH